MESNNVVSENDIEFIRALYKQIESLNKQVEDYKKIVNYMLERQISSATTVDPEFLETLIKNTKDG